MTLQQSTLPRRKNGLRRFARNDEVSTGPNVPAPISSMLLIRLAPAERAVTADPRRKARGAGQGFAGRNHLQPATHLVGDGLIFLKVPLPQRRKPVRAHAELRKSGDIPGEFNGF